MRGKETVPPLDRVTVVELGEADMGEFDGTMLTEVVIDPAKPFKLARSTFERSNEPAVRMREDFVGVTEKFGPVTFSATKILWAKEHGLAAVMKRL